MVLTTASCKAAQLGTQNIHKNAHIYMQTQRIEMHIYVCVSKYFFWFLHVNETFFRASQIKNNKIKTCLKHGKKHKY